jgi:hypothetical protein
MERNFNRKFGGVGLSAGCAPRLHSTSRPKVSRWTPYYEGAQRHGFESDALNGTVIGGMVARTLIRVNIGSDTNTYNSSC